MNKFGVIVMMIIIIAIAIGAYFYLRVQKIPGNVDIPQPPALPK